MASSPSGATTCSSSLRSPEPGPLPQYPPEYPPLEEPLPPPGAYGALGPPPPFGTDPADESLAPVCDTTPPTASAPTNTAVATVTPGERAADRAGVRPRTRRAAAPRTITASRAAARPSGNTTGRVSPANSPTGRPTVLDTTHVASTIRLPTAPSASHHRGALARATAPQAICAAATTTKNARFWALSRPRVAAAAMWMAGRSTESQLAGVCHGHRSRAT